MAFGRDSAPWQRSGSRVKRCHGRKAMELHRTLENDWVFEDFNKFKLAISA
jgi:hypothetical protein